MSPLPITLATASVLALFALVLAFRVSLGRMKHKVSTGDGGNIEMNIRVRSHANFVEYVPLLLILMALLEAAHTNAVFLEIFGAAVILSRLLHAIGMPRKAPNPYRAIGSLASYALLAIGALTGLVKVMVG